MKKLIIGAVMALCASLTFAAPSVKQVEEVISNGDYVAAKAMLQQVVKEHPDSAKAYNYLGQIEAKNKNIAEAQAHFAKQAELDKSIAIKREAERKINEEKSRNSAFAILGVIAGIFILLILGFIVMHYRNAKKDELEKQAQTSLQKSYADKQRTNLLRKATAYRNALRDIELDLNIASTHNKDIESLINDGIDLIEVLSKDVDYNLGAVTHWFNDAEQAFKKYNVNVAY